MIRKRIAGKPRRMSWVDGDQELETPMDGLRRASNAALTNQSLAPEVGEPQWVHVPVAAHQTARP